ncbi:MAG TPA: nucleotidyltransferase family protein [Gaiellaceae bacterium]|nr:nucleotidyltransferase family protein [Gaiellaceae bacterium]
MHDAVVMAAGEGRRLRPLTEHWPKPVLPIDGRPVIVTLLHDLADAGVERVTVVTGHLAEQVEALAAGAEPRLELQFVRQPEPLGSADAVRRAAEAGATPPFLISAADTVFDAGDIGRFATAASVEGASGAISWRRRGGSKSLQIEDGRVTAFLEPGATPHAAAPLWSAGAEILGSLGDLAGPPFELSDAFQRAVDRGKTVLAIEIGPTRDLTEPADVVRENFLYLESER